MEIYPFLPNPLGFRCEHICFDQNSVILELFSTTSTAICPACGQTSHRIHSRYFRTLSDLPWMGMAVRLRLRVRRFFCDTPTCSYRTFAERLPQVATTYARKTYRLAQTLCRIGFAVGGEAGSRLSISLGMPTSGDTILRLIHRTSVLIPATVCVLGVDDWAWRKGQRYGTLLCDLERHRPIDLLPERSAETLARWLAAHPEVTVITRDRGGYYIQGARSGAPQATQVADRFHLLCNLREALVRMLNRYPQALRDVARTVAETQDIPPPEVMKLEPSDSSVTAPPSRAQQEREASRTRRQERYNQVIELHQQGYSIRQIARQMGMHRETIRKFLRCGQFPERATRKYPRRIDAYVDYLRQRWEEGCRDAAQLTRELRQRGFDGSYHMVRRCVAPWRRANDPPVTGRKPTPKDPKRFSFPSANRVAWFLVKNPDDRSVEEQAFVEALVEHYPNIGRAAELTQTFIHMVHEREAEDLEDWILQTHQPDVPSELRVFADGLQLDYKAVKAALSLEWSNGQAEGQINRLKLIKRQMYGRAGFDLLRIRVLNAV